MSEFQKNSYGEKLLTNQYGWSIALVADGDPDTPLFIGSGRVDEAAKGMYLSKPQIKALVKELVKAL